MRFARIIHERLRAQGRRWLRPTFMNNPGQGVTESAARSLRIASSFNCAA